MKIEYQINIHVSYYNMLYRNNLVKVKHLNITLVVKFKSSKATIIKEVSMKRNYNNPGYLAVIIRIFQYLPYSHMK